MSISNATDKLILVQMHSGIPKGKEKEQAMFCHMQQKE